MNAIQTHWVYELLFQSPIVPKQRIVKANVFNMPNCTLFLQQAVHFLIQGMSKRMFADSFFLTLADTTNGIFLHDTVVQETSKDMLVLYGGWIHPEDNLVAISAV